MSRLSRNLRLRLTHRTLDLQMPQCRLNSEKQTLILDIEAKALENEEVIWEQSNQKITIPGTPVGIRLVGSNIIVAVQFTPFIRRSGSVMVAQGQIWISDPEKGVCYYTRFKQFQWSLTNLFISFRLERRRNQTRL